MDYKEKLNEIIEKAHLDEKEIRVIEDFIDNYAGKEEECYMPVADYCELHKAELKNIRRKFIEAGVHGAFVSTMKPHLKEGITKFL